jgi:membrane protease YdiL (CAAX protease family)
MVFATAFLLCALALLSGRVQQQLRCVFRRWPDALYAAAGGIAGALIAATGFYHSFSPALAGLIAVYILGPAVCVYAAGSWRSGAPLPTLLDFSAVALLWLPLELAAGAPLVPKAAQGALHASAYGAAILLALMLFLLFRAVGGMKYAPPQGLDYRNAAIGFAIAAAILIPLGRWVGFLPPIHYFEHRLAAAPVRVLLILFGTALPEELLFRSLIQNFLTRRLGDHNWVIALAAFIFGCAHLNNGPQPSPNWRYAIVAGIAGFIFGKVFQQSRSVFASAFVHAGVDTVKWAFF